MVVRFSFGIVFPQNLIKVMCQRRISRELGPGISLYTDKFYERSMFQMAVFRVAGLEGLFSRSTIWRYESGSRYENFFCNILLVRKFPHEKFLICVILSAFVKYFTTKPIIRTMHSHRIPLGPII